VELMEKDDREWFMGVDWASREHRAWLTDAAGGKLGERSFAHSGEGLGEMADWAVKLTGAPPAAIDVAIEAPHGPVVESLMERGFRLWSINPKQADRFRDRFSPAGAKDDSRDAQVLADALRTDPRAFRALIAADPVMIELREWSRMFEELRGEQTRLANRLRDQLWRYWPAVIALAGGDIAADWFIELITLAPTPEQARRLRTDAVTRLLKRHRIRRLDATGVLEVLKGPPLEVAPGTVQAASAHVKLLAKRLALAASQIREVQKGLDRLLETLAQEDPEPGQPKAHRDVTILRSLPGAGRIVVATMLAEASEPLRRRDYHALRCLAGIAPVTRRSGRTILVMRRRAASRRLGDACYHWARVAAQRDPRSHAKYKALRARGHGHARALRSVADRLLAVACAMLESRTTFDPRLSGDTKRAA
jgi:hypothetical protein